MQNIVKNCDDSRSEAEATAKVRALHSTKKRFAEIYSDDYLERLRNLRNLRITNTNRPKFFRFPMATTAACLYRGALLIVRLETYWLMWRGDLLRLNRESGNSLIDII